VVPATQTGGDPSLRGESGALHQIMLRKGSSPGAPDPVVNRALAFNAGFGCGGPASEAHRLAFSDSTTDVLLTFSNIDAMMRHEGSGPAGTVFESSTHLSVCASDRSFSRD
jgi:hypothetical protein